MAAKITTNSKDFNKVALAMRGFMDVIVKESGEPLVRLFKDKGFVAVDLSEMSDSERRFAVMNLNEAQLL